MIELAVTIDHLPEHILEEIFSFAKEDADLRLVCKTFKNIIDNSAELMKNKWLVLDKVIDTDPKTVNHYYQNLKVNDLSFEVLNWMCYYQRRNRIKTIMIECKQRGIAEPALSVQFIISNFNSLETIYFSSDRFDKDSNPPTSQFKLIPNKLSKLQTLDIGYLKDHPNNILEMFSNIPTIKNLYIHSFDVLKFPTNVNWKLEKLIVPDLFQTEVDNENCKKFLESQQMTLKELVFRECYEYANFIMRNLPNLESLAIGLQFDEEIDDSILLSNNRLERLTVESFFWEDDDVWKTMINHYNKIKYLCIIPGFNSTFFEPVSYGNKFENVTHLMLKRTNSVAFLNSNFPCLKVLILSLLDSEDDFNPNEISNATLYTIEKLAIDTWELNHIFDIIHKCPQLCYLNLSINVWAHDQSPFFVSSIVKILNLLPQLKCLGMIGRNLATQNVKYDELRDHINNKNLTLKIYPEFKSMVAEDWGYEDSFYTGII